MILLEPSHFSAGILLVGCGRIGKIFLERWLLSGIPASLLWIIDPDLQRPSDWPAEILLNPDTLPQAPDIAVLAVKPQIMASALPAIRPLCQRETAFLSLAAGLSLTWLSQHLPDSARIIRAMPNILSQIGQGITVTLSNAAIPAAQMQRCCKLLEVGGPVIRIQDESLMDAITAISGSGPAYVFSLLESLARAGIEQGLSAELSLTLARQTIAGAGALLLETSESAKTLRDSVTSPGGTTAAALSVLMAAENGLDGLISQTVQAATLRSRELGNTYVALQQKS